MAIKAVQLADVETASIDVCNEKTAELLQSLNTNVSRVFRLEKEHTLVFGPRHVCAYGEWYHTNAVKELEASVVDKTVKFLNRMFEIRKDLGKRTAQGGTYYFQSNTPDLLVALTVSKHPVRTGPGIMAPNKMVPTYIEVYYVDASYLG
jgi:hypothetical protein